MNYLLIPLGKMGLALLVFYLFYRLVLSKDQAYIRTRFYFQVCILLSGILPWLRIPLIPVRETEGSFSFAYITGEDSHNATSLVQTTHSFNWPVILTWLYLTGALLLLIRTLLAYYRVFKIIRTAGYEPWGEMQLVRSREKISPFSFFRWLVVPEGILGHPSFEKMAQHELVHCRQYHSVDLFIAEILLILQWFNPIAWLVRKSMVENLEFIVDREILAVGTDARDYQYTLLQFSLGGLKPSIANNFSTNLLKKRITMMNNQKMNKYARLHNLLIPLVLISAMMVTVSFTRVENDKTVKTSIQEKSMPMKMHAAFSKSPVNTTQVDVGDISEEEAFLKYMMVNLKYPVKAMEIQQSGPVNLEVSFGKNGVTVRDANPSSSLSKLKDVIVVGYPPENTNSEIIKSEEKNNNPEILIAEVKKVAEDFKEIPKGLIGKTYILPVIFVIKANESLKSAENESVKILEKFSDTGKSKEPVYILNDEKIITKAELDKIDPINIQSVNVIKANKVEHKTLGVINNSVIIITTKK